MLRWVAPRLAITVLALTLGACSSMKTLKSPTSYVESVRPKLIRITQTDGQRFNMIGARIEGESVMGFVQEPNGVMGEFREVPFSDVRKVEAQQYVHTLTALAVLGSFVAWGALTYAVAHHEDTEGGQVN
jgi:hypothetical protein